MCLLLLKASQGRWLERTRNIVSDSTIISWFAWDDYFNSENMIKCLAIFKCTERNDERIVMKYCRFDIWLRKLVEFVFITFWQSFCQFITIQTYFQTLGGHTAYIGACLLYYCIIPIKYYEIICVQIDFSAKNPNSNCSLSRIKVSMFSLLIRISIVPVHLPNSDSPTLFYHAV